MDKTISVVTGLAGSAALTGIHEALKHKKDTPRVDKLGAEAIVKVIGDGENRPSDDKLYWGSIAGDILSNSILYSGVAKAKNPIGAGLLMGIGIGVTTLVSPNILGLKKKYVQSSKKKMWITIGYYLFGGLMAGITAKLLKKKR